MLEIHLHGFAANVFRKKCVPVLNQQDFSVLIVGIMPPCATVSVNE